MTVDDNIKTKPREQLFASPDIYLLYISSLVMRVVKINILYLN